MQPLQDTIACYMLLAGFTAGIIGAGVVTYQLQQTETGSGVPEDEKDKYILMNKSAVSECAAISELSLFY